MQDRLKLYTSIVPEERQLKIQEMGFYAFVHFGINTFATAGTNPAVGVEWGTGKIPPSAFNPTKLNTDQWVESFVAAGMKAVILTCKHHDGFCLWQTDTTDYSVKSSPYMDGKGDIAKSLSESCKKYGLAFGVYLSPWDRNSEYYGTEQYNDFYIRQLTELLTRYGDIFAVWLDGACGSWMDGKSKQVYDFDRIYRTVRELQPNASISGCGPDVRWIGNEAGITRPSEWNVVPQFAVSTQKIEEQSQQSEGDAKRLKGDAVSDDLGSREFLSHFDKFMWYPGEVDVSIRPGWFYHKSEDGRVRSVDNLFSIYCNSVGGNAMLLLNVPPNTEGLIADTDVKRLAELGARIKSAFANPVKVTEMIAEEGGKVSSANGLKKNKTYAYSTVEAPYRLRLGFQKEEIIDKVVLAEDITHSQRVEEFAIYAVQGAKRKKVYSGTIIGGKKIAWFKPIAATAIELVITSCRLNPYIKTITAYKTDGTKLKVSSFNRLIRFVHRINYKVYVAMQDFKKKK